MARVMKGRYNLHIYPAILDLIPVCPAETSSTVKMAWPQSNNIAEGNSSYIGMVSANFEGVNGCCGARQMRGPTANIIQAGWDTQIQNGTIDVPKYTGKKTWSLNMIHSYLYYCGANYIFANMILSRKKGLVCMDGETRGVIHTLMRYAKKLDKYYISQIEHNSLETKRLKIYTEIPEITTWKFLSSHSTAYMCEGYGVGFKRQPRPTAIVKLPKEYRVGKPLPTRDDYIINAVGNADIIFDEAIDDEAIDDGEY